MGNISHITREPLFVTVLAYTLPTLQTIVNSFPFPALPVIKLQIRSTMQSWLLAMESRMEYSTGS